MAKKYAINRKFTWEDGKEYYIHADNEKDFAVKKAMKIRDLEENKIILSGNMTVSEWSEQFIDVYKVNLNADSLANYKGTMKCRVLTEIGNLRLKQVKKLHCQKVINNMNGLSKSYIKYVNDMMKLMFECAVEDHLIAENPARNLVKIEGTVSERRALTKVEEEYVLRVAATDRRFYNFLLSYHCGCRPSEATEAMGKDISVENGFPFLHIRGTKTKNSDRVVPIPLEFYELIKDIPKFEYIAPKTTGKKYSKSERKDLWNRFKRELNIAMGCQVYRNKLLPPYPLAPDLVPYCLRHTYCTNLARAGVDLRIAQKLMGHSDIRMTANIYTDLNNDDVMAAAKILCQVAPKVAPMLETVEISMV